MRRGEQRGESSLDSEALRYRCYVAIVALVCLTQTVVALLDTLHPGSPSPLAGESTFGALFCGALLAALLSRRVPLRVLDLLVTGAVSVVLAAEMIQSFGHAAPVPARLYWIGLFVILCSITNLPLNLALPWTGAILAAFTALVLTRPPPGDPTLLLEMVVAVVLVLHLAIFGRQVTRERARRQQYRDLALTDPLTGVDNRRAMYGHLERVATGPTFAVVLLDLDHFKAVNDRHGHAVGDRVLQRAAARLASALGPGDHIARWGGEEFLVLLGEADGRRAAEVTARLWHTLRDARAEDLPPFTASLGVAVARPGEGTSSVLTRADAALYRAKAGGRDRWCLDAAEDGGAPQAGEALVPGAG